ncbi:Isocitrate lyase [Frankliniella fusca]|uniref:Isocitrate lyase n=1 Tax=Frankliniella fusca TaxID=407009 RepID=A0AAE1LG02_9NEOP|nr:Isocitrate lyase [Frankliniella fusca]
MCPLLLRGPAIILSNYSKLHLIKGIACTAIERRDFYLLLDEADMRALVLLRCKAFPVSRRHLIASTPLKAAATAAAAFPVETAENGPFLAQLLQSLPRLEGRFGAGNDVRCVVQTLVFLRGRVEEDDTGRSALLSEAVVGA